MYSFKVKPFFEMQFGQKMPNHSLNVRSGTPFLLAGSLSLLLACQATPVKTNPIVSAILVPARPVATISPLVTPIPAVSHAPLFASSTPVPTALSSLGSSASRTLPAGSTLLLSSGGKSLTAAGQSFQIQLELKDANGQILDSGDYRFLFTSSSPNQISVDANGRVTALVAKGSAVITVQIEDSNLQASLNVSVGSSSAGGGSGSTPGSESVTVDANFESLGRGEFLVNTYTTSNQNDLNLAMDAQGNFVAVWQSSGQDGHNTGIYGQRFNSQALPLGDEFRINTYTTGEQTQPDIAMNDAGQFIVTWTSFAQDGDSNGIYAQLFTAKGEFFGSEFRVNDTATNSQTNSAVAIDDDGDFAITWASLESENSFEVMVKAYDSTGQAKGSEFLVNTYNTGRQDDSVIAMDADGDFVIAWQSDDQDGNYSGIYAQRYDSTANPLGSEFRVNTYTTKEQSTLAMAMSDTGQFVVTWTSQDQDGSGKGVFAQRYDSTGHSLGSEFQVNSYTDSSQTNSAVAMDADGDFVVTWQNRQETGGSYDIYAQRYMSTGTAVGSEFYINTTTLGTQEKPAVSINAAGQFVIGWADYGFIDGSSDGVAAKLFDANGQAQ